MAAFAARYARALADVVQSSGLNPEDVNQQVNDFAATLADSRDLREVLLNPSIAVKKRVSILDAVNAKVGCGPKVRNFLAVIISHERLNSLDEIFEEYRAEMNRRLSIADAVITTARPLGSEEKKVLMDRITELSGMRVNATFHEDTSLLGGAIIRIGSTIYDGSLSGRLDRLKERLVSS